MSVLRSRLAFLLAAAYPWTARGALVGLIGGGLAVQFGWYALFPFPESVFDAPEVLIAGGVVGLVPALAVFAALARNATWEFHLLALWDGPLLYVFPSLLIVAATALSAPYVVGALFGLVTCGAAGGSVAFLAQAVSRDTPVPPAPRPPAPTDRPRARGARKVVLGLPLWVWAVLLVGAAFGGLTRVRARNEVARANRVVTPVDPGAGADHRFTGPAERLPANSVGVTEVKLEAATDGDVKKLAPLTDLTALDLRHTRVTDAGLEDLGPRTKLAGLDLFGCAVTDAGLEHLARLTNLTTLNLGNTQVTDAGLRHLAPLTRLTGLNLFGCAVTDAGLKDLARLTRLTRLDLRCQGVTDAGLKALAPLTDLTTLALSSPRVTDAGLRDLTRFTKLTTLDLYGTRATPAALDALRTELPDCTINGVARNKPTPDGRVPDTMPPVQDAGERGPFSLPRR